MRGRDCGGKIEKERLRETEKERLRYSRERLRERMRWKDCEGEIEGERLQ